MTMRVAPNLTLPRDTVTGTIVVYGGKGMGKTNFGTVLCEELAAAGDRFAAIDPMGVFWGLRHSKDGKGKGIEVLILGGRHGDIPIEPTGGSVVADLVANEDVDVIVDISRRPDDTKWSIGERIRFVADFSKRLHERQNEKRPRMLVIDEAGRFAQEQVRHGDQDAARCLSAVATIVEEGRNFGLGITLITQRSARMSKAVSELAECMVAFRTVGPRSVQAILDWFGEHVAKSRWNELVEQLRALPRGTALVVSPGWLQFEGIAEIRPRNTFDTSGTPERGKERHAAGKGSKPDLSRYQELMAETIERAKASDPKELRATIARLQEEVDKRKAEPAVGGKGTGGATKKGYDRAAVDKAVMRASAQTAAALARELTPIFKKARHAMEDTAEKLREVAEKLIVAMPPETLESKVFVDLPPEEEPADDPAPRGDSPRRQESSGGAAQRILDALAELEALGVDRPPKVQVAFMAGYTNLNSKGFVNAIGALRTGGKIEYPEPGKLALTSAGRAEASPVARPRTSKELQDRLIHMLGGANGRIIRALVDVHPQAMPREELAARAGYTNLNSKGFVNAVGRLRTLGFLDYPERGSVRANDILFIRAAAAR